MELARGVIILPRQTAGDRDDRRAARVRCTTRPARSDSVTAYVISDQLYKKLSDVSTVSIYGASSTA